MTAHDTVPAHEPLPGVEEVHRAALAAGAPRRLAEQLRHHRGGGDAAHQRLAVLAVGADNVVIVTERVERPHGDGFLPDVEVAKAADLAEGIRLGGLLFEAADEQHLPQHATVQLGLALVFRSGGGRGGHGGSTQRAAPAAAACSHAW